MPLIKNQKAWHAVQIGTMCSLAYLGVYFARNTLSAVTPQIIEDGVRTTESIGTLSSVYFVMYAIGQLINGQIGDRIKSRYMISCGLFFAGICNFFLPMVMGNELLSCVVYGGAGVFLSMIFAPMTKVVAENTEPIYATRCSLGYTFASFLGTPLAGLAASLLAWRWVFRGCSAALMIMGAVCFAVFLLFERRGIVQYGQYQPPVRQGLGKIRVLVEHRIVKFTMIAIVTGIVRTSVVFWLPTYLNQHLGFASDTAARIFTVATFAVSMASPTAIFAFERLKRNMDLTIFLAFSLSAVCFVLVFFMPGQLPNIVCLVLAIFFSNCASSVLWARYCPSLRDTGMVSSASGFLDFVSYMAAAASSKLFANAVAVIGWSNLILVWFGLMAFGVMVSIPVQTKKAALS